MQKDNTSFLRGATTKFKGNTHVLCVSPSKTFQKISAGHHTLHLIKCLFFFF
jgi:hypothetical protein